ncbi:MAG: nucleoside deaminase [Phycisphaeraceae bacterium]|nr:MAG: nucleoside deaminase [Phycisphaeraceae bacterium]
MNSPRGALWMARALASARAPATEPLTSGPHDAAMMGEALALAEVARALGEVPVGAVVFRSATGEVVGRGYNRREVDKDPAAHAELIAVREAARRTGDWRLTGCTLAVTLEPCAMCAGLIVNARLDRVVYGADDPKAGAARSVARLLDHPRLNHRAPFTPGVMGGACGEILREFFRSLRRGNATPGV